MESLKANPKGLMSTEDYTRQFFKTRMCRFHTNSKCFKGAECTHAHSRDELLRRPNLRKTAMCRHWLTSQTCEKDRKCPYAHGEDELRSAHFSGQDSSANEPVSSKHRRGPSKPGTLKGGHRRHSQDTCAPSSSPSPSFVSMHSNPNDVYSNHAAWGVPQLICYDPTLLMAPTAFQYPFVPPLYTQEDSSPREMWQD